MAQDVYPRTYTAWDCFCGNRSRGCQEIPYFNAKLYKTGEGERMKNGQYKRTKNRRIL